MGKSLTLKWSFARRWDCWRVSFIRSVWTKRSNTSAVATRCRDGRIVVTFDDGYADNYEVAMPVLNHAGVPATFYVTVDCVENKRLPWPSRLRFAFRNTKRSAWSDSQGKNWPLNLPAEREAAFLSSCDACCQLSGAVQENFVVGVERGLEAKIPCQQDSGDAELRANARAAAARTHCWFAHHDAPQYGILKAEMPFGNSRSRNSGLNSIWKRRSGIFPIPVRRSLRIGVQRPQNKLSLQATRRR